MGKPVTKEFNIAVNHIEAALVSYLKPYFPEAVEIEGVDISFPVSNPGSLNVKVYLKQKDTKQGELLLEPVSEKKEDNVVDLSTAKKTNNKRKNNE